MNRSVVAVSAVLFSGLVSGNEVCDFQSQMAEMVMEARQKEVPMRDMMKTAPTMGEQQKLAEVLIEEAYSQPAAAADENKVLATKRFGNQVYLACLKTQKE